ncbi:MAG: hypothetical protein MI700_13180 [Balneolales bacterium]|nr:hypothetical protein [Balneolales bacterium]
MSKQEFYIGWQDEMPQGNRSFLRKVIIAVFVLIPVIVFITVSFQKPFSDHQFEFGTQTELTGIYYPEPFPMLVVEEGIPEGFSNHVLLVGLGKFGARGILENIESEEAGLYAKQVTLNGTLIYGDGVTLFELTDQEGSFVAASDLEIPVTSEERWLSHKTLTGEILDAKCYFGVMKPGEGKVHKSCAIRCISGGIPPVIRVAQNGGMSYDYYLVKGEQGQDINKEVLPFVAETITLEGESYTQNGWKVIQINPSTIQRNLAINEQLYPDRSTVASLMPDYGESRQNFCTYPGR